MPKEKINHAPEYVKQTPLSDLPTGTVASGSVSTIEWKPVVGGEDPGAWVPDGAGDDLGGRDAELLVGWHRDSWVQLSIEGDPRYFQMATKYLDAEDGRTSVYTPPLSRDELNKLIRVLRRARDQVFGRDE